MEGKDGNKLLRDYDKGEYGPHNQGKGKGRGKDLVRLLESALG